MLINKKISLVLGIIITTLGILIIPTISIFIFGSNICGHSNMYLVGLAIFLIGIFIIFTDVKH